MGFNSVYQCLVEVFPEVDSRLLRAVAIEHSKDAEAAVEVVLLEVIPYLSTLSAARQSTHKQQNGVASYSMPKDKNPLVYSSTGHVPSNHSADFTGLSEDEGNANFQKLQNGVGSNSCLPMLKDKNSLVYSVTVQEPSNHTADFNELSEDEDGKQIDLVRHRQVVFINSAASCSGTKATDAENSCNNDQASGASVADSLNASMVVLPVNNCSADILGNQEAEMTSNVASSVTKAAAGEDFSETNLTSGHYLLDSKPLDASTVSNYYDANEEKYHPTQLVENEEVILLRSKEEKDYEFGSCQASDVNSKTVIHQMSQFEADHDLQTNLIQNVDAGSAEKNDVREQKDLFGSGARDFDLNTFSENSPNEDEHTFNTIVTRSGQICNVDLLEEIIEEAKNNKQTLFSAMESIMNLMKEVENQEKAAEQAKVEAAEAGFDIINKVNELKEMLSHAKEANDMHAGEVYGEKAILATEVKELQNRVLSLGEERDASLSILDVMRQTLEARLAEAEEMRKIAEQEKLEKTESAQLLLTEQEAIMEKVVQESKTLQQEAEENSKLRDFLIERGRIVDALQGEISVICKDVRMLKENFDDCVPLSKSFSSSQTSCILASSGSSLKTLASDLEKSLSPKEGSSSLSVDGLSQKGSPKERSRSPSIGGQSQNSSPSASTFSQSPKRSEDGADQQELLDDSWELCEDEIHM